MTDFVQQLKRRAVVQWTLAYLGGAWLVLQILDVVADPWGVSDGIARGVQISLALGLLLTLVLAWFHGERADQLPTGLTPGLHAIRAEILTAAGDYDAALSELEAAMDLGFAVGPILLREWPAFDPLRGTVRFDAILGRMSYP